MCGTLRMPNTQVRLSIRARHLPRWIITTVTLVNGTGISGATGAGTYMKGSNVSLSATLMTDYAWNNWLQTSDSTAFSTAQAYTITDISAPYALTAAATTTVYDATVTVKTDDTTWTSGTPVMKLSESSSDASSGAVTGTVSSGVYTFTALAYSKDLLRVGHNKQPIHRANH